MAVRGGRWGDKIPRDYREDLGVAEAAGSLRFLK
jgi:hypothetical protein